MTGVQLSENSETPEGGSHTPAPQSVNREEKRQPGEVHRLPNLAPEPGCVPAGLEKIKHPGKMALTGGSGQETDNKNSPAPQHPWFVSCLASAHPSVLSWPSWPSAARGDWPGAPDHLQAGGFVSFWNPSPPQFLRAPRAPRACCAWPLCRWLAR